MLRISTGCPIAETIRRRNHNPHATPTSRGRFARSRPHRRAHRYGAHASRPNSRPAGTDVGMNTDWNPRSIARFSSVTASSMSIVDTTAAGRMRLVAPMISDAAQSLYAAALER